MADAAEQGRDDAPAQGGLQAERVALDVLDSLLEGCQVIDREWRYVFVNDTVVRQGKRAREELIGRTMAECYPGIEQSPMFAELQRCMASREHHVMENEFTFPDGSKGWFELRFVPVPEGVCILSLDVTGRKRAEAALSKTESQLRQAQKMEAIGRLAGGVAHDFNNMLSVIISYAGLSRQALGDAHPVSEDVAEIERAGLRAAELTKQLLAFSRQQVIEARVIDLNESLASMDKLLKRLIGSDIALHCVRAPGLKGVLADASQVEQVIINLAVNARDAMPEGGRLTIETANVDLDEAYAREHLGTKPGPHVMLAVSDTGHGMSAETQAQIFEPFFTTKAEGKGTGLGLATVFGVVQQCGGSIWVYSEPGKGTTFKCYFPAVAAERVSGREAKRKAAAPKKVKRLRILVVEDQEQLRGLVVNLLLKMGHEVVAPESAIDALRLDAQFDLLLTDVVMPDLNGREVADRLKETRPAMRVLFMSGYTGEVVVQHRVLAEGVSFLQKPITPSALEAALARLFAD